MAKFPKVLLVEDENIILGVKLVLKWPIMKSLSSRTVKSHRNGCQENPILSCLTLCCRKWTVFSLPGAEVREDTNSIPIIILTARWKKKAVSAPGSGG